MLLTMAALLIYTGLSITYVYAFRGDARWGTFKEYSRKAWPIFAPLNCLLYAFTTKRGQKAYPDVEDFSELDSIHANWEVIRDEAQALLDTGYFEKTTDTESGSYYDVGFRTFFKYGWSKFYLKWYGYTHESGKRLCPKTVALLQDIPMVKGAMFALLPARSELTRHSDPIAVSLRYHLGLITPNSDDCYINVDGKRNAWRDGVAFIFDETYPHFVENNTDERRLILMCDIARPTHTLGRVFHFFYERLAGLTVVPNLEGDKRGFANRVFSSLAPTLARAKALKTTNLSLYKALKLLVNGSLILILLLIISGIVSLFT
ncbi:MAG: aspartyl/asparaginyl beta-hydroxylase domain-containing protein [Pseudomonadota bacterium]